MKHLVIAIIILWAAFHFGRCFSAKDRSPDVALAATLVRLQRSISEPSCNGYFYNELWQRLRRPGKTDCRDLRLKKTGSKRARAHLTGGEPQSRPPIAPHLSDQLRMRKPTIRCAFREKETAEQHCSYRCSSMTTGSACRSMIGDSGAEPRRWDGYSGRSPFVCRGRLFRQHDGRRGAAPQRLSVWRTVLREAKTISTKVLAQIVIADDLQLLSRMLAKPMVDKTILTMGLQLTLPLSGPEYSLRWPIRHQVALAMKDRSADFRNMRATRHGAAYEDWLSRTGHLPSDAFDSIIHPPTRPATGSFQWGQAARCLRGLLRGHHQGFREQRELFTGMQEVVGTLHRGMFDGVLKSRLVEPGWEIFHGHGRNRYAAASGLAADSASAPKLANRSTDQARRSRSQYFDPLRDCQCCGVLPNKNSIASEEIDWMTVAIRPSISACLPQWDKH